MQGGGNLSSNSSSSNSAMLTANAANHGSEKARVIANPTPATSPHPFVDACPSSDAQVEPLIPLLTEPPPDVCYVTTAEQAKHVVDRLLALADSASIQVFPVLPLKLPKSRNMILIPVQRFNNRDMFLFWSNFACPKTNHGVIHG
jgi:hypothetical protein